MNTSTKPTSTAIANDYVSRYTRHWARLEWNATSLREKDLSRALREPLKAIAYAEAHTFEEARKICLAGLHRHRDIREFLPRWLAEELEHGNALSCASKLDSDFRIKSSILGRIRSAISPLMLLTVRRLPGLDLAFLCLGAAAEFMTHELYQHLARRCTDPELGRLFRDLAKQEARHLTFYISAAKARRGQSRLNLSMGRLILRLFWRPVGMDTLGDRAWHATVGNFLRDAEFLARSTAMDDLMSKLPGMQDLELMKRFLIRTGYLPVDQPCLDGGRSG